jgi:hypothetical protein
VVSLFVCDEEMNKDRVDVWLRESRCVWAAASRRMDGLAGWRELAKMLSSFDRRRTCGATGDVLSLIFVPYLSLPCYVRLCNGNHSCLTCRCLTP